MKNTAFGFTTQPLAGRCGCTNCKTIFMEQPRYCPKCHQTFDPAGDSVWAFYSTEKTIATCESKGFGDCDPDSDYVEKEQPKTVEPDKKK